MYIYLDVYMLSTRSIIPLHLTAWPEVLQDFVCSNLGVLIECVVDLAAVD